MQIAEPAFWPQTAEGIFWLIGKVFGFLLLVLGSAWRVYVQRVKDLKQIEDKHQTEVEARKMLAQEVKDEIRTRGELRIEMKRDLGDEAAERKARDDAHERRTMELAESLHVIGGNMTNLTDKVAHVELARAEEMGALQLKIERGFYLVREQMHEEIQSVIKLLSNRERQ
jgi:hypothetical protein